MVRNISRVRFSGQHASAPIRSRHPSVAADGRHPPDGASGHSVLYTSLERDGAIAEVASFLAALTPIPGPRQIDVTRLAVSASQTLRLVRADLATLGVHLDRYGERDYGRTQEIGAALVFLGFDGLIAPSARWPCDNLMIFSDNHALSETLQPVGTDKVEWRAWALSHGILAVTSAATAETPDGQQD